MLFLSRKVTLRAAPVCAQPSGYLIENAPPVYLTKTWLSGMSPAAAEAGSACNAPGPVCVVAVVAGAGRVVVAGAAVVVAACLAPPQPARIAAATSRRAARGIAAKRPPHRPKTA